MLVFWAMFVVAAWGVLTPKSMPAAQARAMWLAVGFTFTLLIGLRHEVGGDWFNYIPHFLNASTMTFSEAAAMGDPGHYVLNMWVSQAGGDIYLVNLVYAVLMMWGTMVFCRRQPNPWLALMVAVPYMLIVVGMGYTRQSAALGLSLIGLVALGEHRVRTFIVCVAIGALFHKSAVLLMPIAALAASRNRILTGAIVAVSALMLYYLLLVDTADDMWRNYVEEQMQSQGGLIRVVMNFIPAMLLIVFRRRLVADPQERKLWLWIAVFAIVCVPMVFLASTAVDRVALYFIPLQLFVFARLPGLATNVTSRTGVVVGIVLYYAAVQYIWLNFATHSQYWTPYQFMQLG
ncbi:EpsG family protein [Arenimonas sp.]|uniref:EpsG family protein n=1 Tax=Arenimonas sp. TaxID=1872635 RepID=UPI0025C25EF4|nr:EpsG family protein [Arenimonas sp.]